MAGKMEPEDAFRLLGRRGEGVKTRIDKGDNTDTKTEDGTEKSTPAEPSKWGRYFTIAFVFFFTSLFISAVLIGGILLYDQKPVVEEKPQEAEELLIFSEHETKQLITQQLAAFLKCTNTPDRLRYVLTPKTERAALEDYYEGRGNLDSPLWKVKLIKAANLEGEQIWMVAYLDLNKVIHYKRFGRSGNSFYIQWASSYSYGQLPWNEFASTQPRDPVQMRCFVLRHTGTLPPGIDSANYGVFVIENKRGEFTSVAIMHQNSEGFQHLANLPRGTRSPVNLKLKYTDLSNGNRQLTIDQLIHFQWHQNTMSHKGRPVELSQ